MFEAIKSLIDSGLINEEAQTQIEEAWNSKVSEIRESVATEMRSEFAARYEHDKSKMVEALDRMVTEGLTAEIESISEEKARVVEDRTRTVAKLAEQAEQFENFLTRKLAEELREFHEDRKQSREAIATLESFVENNLKKELTEFAEDKQDLVNTKVKLVSEAKSKFSELKRDFVARSGQAVSEAVNQTLRSEISQLREDITAAQQNNFGRKLFEAFASEFSATHLNENAEIKSLKKQIEQINQNLEEAQQTAKEKQKLAESKQQEIEAINESVNREKTLNQLLKPLSKEKAQVMENLLESVSTDRLKSSFDRYLPAVMNGSSREVNAVLTESVTTEVTGNRKAKAQEVSADVDSDGNIIEIKRLAGL